MYLMLYVRVGVFVSFIDLKLTLKNLELANPVLALGN
jgi:hypothetical protein